MIRNTLPFATVPEWLLLAEVSDRAVRLYAVLVRHADRDARAHPSRRRLAEMIRCSVDSIDRALRELVDAGALDIEHRVRDDNTKTSNEYVLRPGGRMVAATPLGNGAASRNESHSERETPAAPSRGGVQKMGKPRPPDPVFDELAELHGGRASLSSPMARSIGVALAAIRRATPRVSTDEIRRRATNYRRLSWNRERQLPTAAALAKWWADCDMPGTTVPTLPRNRTLDSMTAAEIEEAMRG